MASTAAGLAAGRVNSIELSPRRVPGGGVYGAGAGSGSGVPPAAPSTKPQKHSSSIKLNYGSLSRKQVLELMDDTTMVEIATALPGSRLSSRGGGDGTRSRASLRVAQDTTTTTPVIYKANAEPVHKVVQKSPRSRASVSDYKNPTAAKDLEIDEEEVEYEEEIEVEDVEEEEISTGAVSQRVIVVTSNRGAARQTNAHSWKTNMNENCPVIISKKSESFLPKLVALYDWEGRNDDELSFKAGDTIIVYEKDELSGWWRGRVEGSEPSLEMTDDDDEDSVTVKIASFPYNYCKPIMKEYKMSKKVSPKIFDMQMKLLELMAGKGAPDDTYAIFGQPKMTADPVSTYTPSNTVAEPASTNPESNDDLLAAIEEMENLTKEIGLDFDLPSDLDLGVDSTFAFKALDNLNTFSTTTTNDVGDSKTEIDSILVEMKTEEQVKPNDDDNSSKSTIEEPKSSIVESNEPTQEKSIELPIPSPFSNLFEPPTSSPAITPTPDSASVEPISAQTPTLTASPSPAPVIEAIPASPTIKEPEPPAPRPPAPTPTLEPAPIPAPVPVSAPESAPTLESLPAQLPTLTQALPQMPTTPEPAATPTAPVDTTTVTPPPFVAVQARPSSPEPSEGNITSPRRLQIANARSMVSTELKQMLPPPETFNSPPTSPKSLRAPQPQAKPTKSYAIPLTAAERKAAKDRRPPWIPDEAYLNCMVCKAAFTFTNRRHHCRQCGKLVCNRCCSSKAPLPHLAYKNPQPVCNSCAVELASHT